MGNISRKEPLEAEVWSMSARKCYIYFLIFQEGSKHY